MIRSTRCPLERPRPVDCERTSSPPNQEVPSSRCCHSVLVLRLDNNAKMLPSLREVKETRWRPPAQEWEQKKTEAHLTAPFPKVGFTQKFKPTCDIIGTKTASFASSSDTRMSCEDLSITKEHGSPNLSFQVFCSF